ncbi:MAG: hypothetical protein Q9195_008972 [Heterodermia aff. obscurata]
MDPFTATLTFVGLSASLITLLTAVGDASKTLFELQRKIKNAPRSAQRLHQDLQIIQVLLEAINNQSLHYKGLDVPQPLQDLWKSFVLQLESDVRDFKARMSTLKLPRQSLKARIGHVFAEGIVSDFQHRYSAHIQTLIMVQNMMDGTSRFYSFPAGKLLVQYTTSHDRCASPENGDCGVTEVDMIFIPPWFMSNTIIRAHMGYSHSPTYRPPRPTYSLDTITINQDPELWSALMGFNVPKLKELFWAGRARPTDMILGPDSEHPITLVEATLQRFVSVIPCSFALYRHKILLDFLLDRAPISSDQALIVFLASMNRSWSYDNRQNLDCVFEDYFRSIIAHHETSLEDIYVRSSRLYPEWVAETIKYDICNGEIKMSILPALLEGGFGFDVVPNIIQNYSQPWVVEDLGSSSVWYIGILANSDRTFYRILRSCLCIERSLSKASYASVAESILHSVFGIDAVVSQVLDASMKERNRFIRTLIEKGTTSMLEPFVDAGFNLDEGHIKQNYLGLSAKLGKLDFFNMLVDAGASCARAIACFCLHANKLKKPVFKSLLSRLLDRATADAAFTFDSRYICEDALHNILTSNDTMDLRPDGPAILLKRGIFNRGKVVGTGEMFPHSDYAVCAIRCNRPAALKLLLEHGTPWNIPIGEIYPNQNRFQWPLYDYTLLTLAVELGQIACVETLIKHADKATNSVLHPDRRDRSALQLAMSAVVATHPRDTICKGRYLGAGAEAGESSAFQDTSILALLQDALPAEHNKITNASERAEMIGITKPRSHARRIVCSRFPMVATMANSSFSSPIVTSCGHAQCFLVDFLFDIVLFFFCPKPNGSFSWVNGVHHPYEIVQRCKRCGKEHNSYYITRHIIRVMWAQLKRMSIFEGVLVAMGYFAMYAVLVAHTSLKFALSSAAAARIHYMSGRYYAVLGVASIWALTVLWGKRL